MKPLMFLRDIKTREIIANRDEKYNLDSFYMYFGNLKSLKLSYESRKEKEIAKFFELLPKNWQKYLVTH